MITVRMLGGARKSFPGGTVTLDGDGITVSDLFGMLAGCKPPGTPDLDTRNVLVAINGADSSVAGGLSATIQDGDRVDIIPVIHGGIPGLPPRYWRYQRDGAARTKRCGGPRRAAAPLCRRTDTVHKLRVHTGAPRTCGAYWRYPSRAERRGTMLTDRIETDMMLRLVGTTQISEAIGRAGAGAGPGRGRLWRWETPVSLTPCARRCPVSPSRFRSGAGRRPGALEWFRCPPAAAWRTCWPSEPPWCERVVWIDSAFMARPAATGLKTGAIHVFAAQHPSQQSWAQELMSLECHMFSGKFPHAAGTVLRCTPCQAVLLRIAPRRMPDNIRILFSHNS